MSSRTAQRSRATSDPIASLLKREGPGSAPVAAPARSAAVPGLLRSRSLAVGSAHDPAEGAADARADSAVEALHGPGHQHAHQSETSGVAAAPGAAHRSASAVGAIGAVGAAGGSLDARTTADIEGSRGGGSPLGRSVREPLENAMGADLGAVRVHTGPKAAGLNDAMSAKAFTSGSDVFFRDGMPDIAKPAGAHLLAHEVAHTLEPGAATHRSVRRVLNPKRLDWTAVTSVKELDVGMTNLGIYEVSDGTSTVTLKFVQEAVRALPFGDRVQGAVGLANPETTPSTDVAGACASMQSVLDAMKNGGKAAEAAKVEALMVKKGTLKATGVLFMTKVEGVDLADQQKATGSQDTPDDKAKAVARGADPNLDVIERMTKADFVYNLGKMAVGDALMGNSDRFAVERHRKELDGRMNSQNMKVLASGAIGTFDHDTRVYAYKFMEAQRSGMGLTFDVQAWTDVLIGGEVAADAVSERPIPSLGAIFQQVGQQLLYDQLLQEVKFHYSDNEVARFGRLLPLDRFQRHFQRGLRDGVIGIRKNATALRKEAKKLAGTDQAGNMLDPEALDVKLAFIEAKAKDVTTKRGDGKRHGSDLASALADNSMAEDAAKTKAFAAQADSALKDPNLDPAPVNPGGLGILEAGRRKLKGEGRDDDATAAKGLREQAQQADLPVPFMDKLDANINKLEKAAGTDRRSQSALFHLKLVRVARDAERNYLPLYSTLSDVMGDTSPLSEPEQRKVAGVGAKARSLSNYYSTLTDGYLKQLGDREDREQSLRATRIARMARHDLGRIAVRSDRLAKSLKKPPAKAKK